MKKIVYILSLVTLLVMSLPQYSNAQSSGQPGEDPVIALDTGVCKSITNIDSVVTCGISILQIVIYFIISIAMVYTLYCAFKFITSDGNGKSEWRDKMIRGIIALVVMVSIWGIINIFTNTFGFSNNAQITVPTFGNTSTTGQ